MWVKAAAALINLILLPGAGHFAIGRTRRGIPWLVLQLAVPFLVLLHPLGFLVGFLGARLGSAVEVGLLRPESRDPIRVAATFGGALVIAIVFALGVRTFVVEAFKTPASSMAPTLLVGDHLLVNKLSYRFGEPARGDLAVFVAPCEPDKDFIKRVVGLAGDTIEVRCDVLYVNNVAVPAQSLKDPCSYWDREDGSEGWKQVDCVTYVEKLAGIEHELVFPSSRRDADRLRKVTGEVRSYEDLAGIQDFPGDRTPDCDPSADPRTPEARTRSLGRVVDAPTDPTNDACSPHRHYVVPAGHVFVMGDNRENSSDSRAWGAVPEENLKGKAISIWWSSGPPQEGIRWDRIGTVR